MSVLNRPKIEAYIGASGTGKGVSINRRLAALKPKRLVIYDPRDEYEAQAQAVRSLPELVKVCAKKGAFRVRYVPAGNVKPMDAFGMVCDLVFAAGDLVFVAEELSDVTTPSFAPPSWRRLTTQGRHRGLHILGAAQRPSLIDKTFLGNCTHVRCFALGYATDVRAMAAEMRCDPGHIERLATEDTAGGVLIRYMEFHRRTRELFAGQIAISGARVAEKQQPMGLKKEGAT